MEEVAELKPEVRPDDIIPECKSFRENATLRWPERIYERVVKRHGLLAEKREELVQAHGSGDNRARLPGPLTPVPCPGLMGTTYFVTGRLPNENQKKKLYILTFHEGNNKPVDEEALFDSLLLARSVDERKAGRVAMQRIGCKRGQLQWGAVKKMIETVFRATNIVVAVYCLGSIAHKAMEIEKRDQRWHEERKY